MSLPVNAYGVGVLVILVLPGVVWTSVRIAVRGRVAHDRDVSARILQALMVSVVLDATYILVAGDRLVGQIRAAARGEVAQPRVSAAAVLILMVAVPALLAYLVYGRPRWRNLKIRGLHWLRLPLSQSGYEATPTVWDWAAPQRGGCWVRIRVGEGKWVGGWYGDQSFVSTYPEARDIYVEEQHHVDAAGVIGGLAAGSAGFWLSLKDGDVVEWVNP